MPVCPILAQFNQVHILINLFNINLLYMQGQPIHIDKQGGCLRHHVKWGAKLDKWQTK
jgi:hypothetical protein